METKKPRCGWRASGWAMAGVLAWAGLPAGAEPVRPGKAVKVQGPARTPAKGAEKPERGGQLFAVVLGPGPAWKKGQPLRKKDNARHWRYWQDLRAEGIVETAGQVGKDTGFALIRARNQSAANTVLAQDPAIRTGQYRAVARPYDETLGD